MHCLIPITHKIPDTQPVHQAESILKILSDFSPDSNLISIFPKDYEKNRAFLNEDSKVFVKGRVSEEDDNASKLICESIVPFEQTRCELWLQLQQAQEL